MKNNWQIKKLGEVCEVIAGQSPEGHFYNNEGIGLPFYQGKKEFGEKYIGEPKVWTSKITKEAEVKDILMSVRAPVGPINFSTQKICIGRGLAAIRATDEVDVNYLYYYLESNEDNISGNSGAVFASINKFQIESIEIPVPPIEEQKKIVKILDGVFENIAKAKENAEKNLQNTKDLFESYLQSVFSNPGKDWENKKIIDIFQIKPPKSEAKEKFKDDDLVSFVPMEDMRIMSKEFICNKERKFKEVSGSYTYFANEDVLLAKITPCFENGKIGIARNLKNGIGFGSSEYIVFRSKGDVTPDYLYYFLNRREFREVGAKRMSGAVGHKRVSKEFIEENILAFPKSFFEQKSIVAKLDALSAETKKLEEIYKQKLVDLEELKKSVLKKAFNGEL